MNDDVQASAVASLGSVTALATAGARHYLSSQHRWAAEHFAGLAEAFEDRHVGEGRAYW